MHWIIIGSTIVVPKSTFVVSCDEVTTIDNQFSCNVHTLLLMPLLLNLERVVGRGFVDNLVTSILKSLMKYGCLIVEQISGKMVCFGLDGLQPTRFISMHIGVAISLIEV
jgi:hypothetical protein